MALRHHGLPGFAQGVPAADRQLVLAIGRPPAFLLALETALGAACELRHLSEGGDALQQVPAFVPDLILLCDTVELCRQLKASARTRDVPVIICAGSASAANEARGLELGAIDFLRAPIDPGLLALRIQNHLREKRTRDRIAGQSSIDEATGLGNRRWLEGMLTREWHRALRQAAPLSLLLVDAGGGEPDLPQVAAALKAALHRPGDMAARYGARDFAALLPQTDRDGAAHVAARLRAALPAAAIGVVTRIPEADQDPVELLRLADEQVH